MSVFVQPSSCQIWSEHSKTGFVWTRLICRVSTLGSYVECMFGFLSSDRGRPAIHLLSTEQTLNRTEHKRLKLIKILLLLAQYFFLTKNKKKMLVACSLFRVISGLLVKDMRGCF